MSVIRVEKVSKKYVFYNNPVDYFKKKLMFGKQQVLPEFWALKDIDLEVKKGEVIGIIGDNGSGKSTLLRLLAGITQPTQGKIFVSGRIGNLLAMGAGFHPEFTGRENIYMNCSILGLNKDEINTKINDIIDFSELGDFLDRPVKTYSSGMYARLGFSIASSIDPEILIIDEVLAVGDEYFQRKCVEKIKEIIKKSVTVILVSHSLHFIQNLCTRALWLKNGVIIGQGNPDAVAGEYINYVRQRRGQIPEAQKIPEGNNNRPGDGRYTGGIGEIKITKVRIIDSDEKECRLFKTGEDLSVEVFYKCYQPVELPIFGVAIFRNDGVYCYGPNTMFDKMPVGICQGEGKIAIKYKAIPLLAGSYEISVGIFDKEHVYPYDFHMRLYNFEIKTDLKDHGLVRLSHEWQINN